MLALRHVSLTLAFILSLGTGAPQGMTLAEAPLQRLIDEADLVIHGVVLERQVAPIPGQTHALRTRYTLWVWEHLKAPSPSLKPEHRRDELLTVVQPGGTLGSLTTRVPGVVDLELGTEVILLLSKTPWGLQPLGYPMGTFIIGADGLVRSTWRAHHPADIEALFGFKAFRASAPTERSHEHHIR